MEHDRIRRSSAWEGREEGREEGKLETAKNALSKGLPLETIRDITGLDTETIRNLSTE
jgi:predicted transposase/invertase (TIGR01784 family)